jgi:predicted acetyltransferase
MAFHVRTTRDLDEYRKAVSVIGHYFGWEPTAEDAERFSRLLPPDRLHCVFDGSSIVAAAGVMPLELTIPGGRLTCAGVTVVGVLPSHRRRGLLTRMMGAQLRDVGERGVPIAALWASEETIYGRYGYGLASVGIMGEAKRLTSQLRADLPAREGSIRMIDHDEALRVLPPLYNRIAKGTVGFLGRPRDWWELRTLDDREERRRGAGPLNRVLLELDGKPAGYATYRIKVEGSGSEWHKKVLVGDAFGLDARATREIWRFLLEIDWTDTVETRLLPLDHPLLLLTARINELRARLWDGLWIRLVDVGAALAARSYAGDGRLTLEVSGDPLFPENQGTWTIDGGVARRSRRRPDLRLEVQALGAAFLGGFSFRELAAAERVEEVVRGGIARADRLFVTSAAPWCPEIF